MTSELPNYTSLIRQTIKTLGDKTRITPGQRQQALRFYFWLQEYLPGVDKETKNMYKEYEDFLRKKGVLQW